MAYGDRRKGCKLCADKIAFVDYKDEKVLRRFVTDRGKIVPRRVSGNCSRHQLQLGRAIRRARFLAMLPYVDEGSR
jgi:small subunit ribosomal protein S18